MGHFVNSLHFWSTQIFFFAMVVHLWGKFWMAAWRGKRVLTWVTGVVAFLASVGTAFTGYLVQTNFDSQWISSEAKDGLNSVGVGAWFNVLNLGQALLIHVALLPLVLALIIVMHVLLVRRHGVVPPIDQLTDGSDLVAGAPDVPAQRDTPAKGRKAVDPAAQPWRGPKRRYDLVKELTVALVVVAVLTVGLAALFSSPDEKALTLKGWATPRRTTSSPPPRPSSTAPAARRATGRRTSTSPAPGRRSARCTCRSGPACASRSTRRTSSSSTRCAPSRARAWRCVRRSGSGTPPTPPSG